MKIEEVMTTIQSVTGNHTHLKYITEQTPRKEHKGKKLEKIVTGAFRAGIAFENLGQVKEAIERGERGEVESLPWGHWVQYPYRIDHEKDGVEKSYIRFYPPTGGFIQIPKVEYYIDGKSATKEEYVECLTDSQKNPKPKDCFVVEVNNILELGKKEE